MKLQEFLINLKLLDIKNHLSRDMIGIPSKEIKTRFVNGNIILDDTIIRENIEIGDIEFIQEIGDFIFDLIKTHPEYTNQLKIFKLDGIMNSNIDSELKRYLDNYSILKFSKKETIIINKVYGI